jgi:hypothetical protein
VTGTIEGRFAMTKDDFVRVNGIMIRSRPWVRPFYLFMGVAFFLCIATNLFVRSGPRFGRMALELLFLTALVAIPLFIAPWIQTRHTLKGNVYALAEQTWSLGPDGAVVTTPASEGRFQWSVVVRVTEHRDYLLFYVSDCTALPVPKRAFQGPIAERLRADLKSWLGAKAELA